MQRCSGPRLSSLLASRLQVMKVISGFCLSLFWLLSLLLTSGISSVKAQTDYPTAPPENTSTPVPTSWSPLFGTATPNPTKDYSCPAGTPVGYGQVTPNAAWNSQCQACLPIRTAVWPTQSGTAQPTAIATSAPTPTPGGVSEYWLQEKDFDYTTQFNVTSRYDKFFEYPPQDSNGGTGSGTLAGMFLKIDSTTGTNMDIFFVSDSWRIGNYTLGANTTVYQVQCDWDFQNCDQYFSSRGIPYIMKAKADLGPVPFGGGGNRGIGWKGWACCGPTVQSVVGKYGNIWAGTPPEPPSNSICGEVNKGFTPGAPGDNGNLPSPMIGNPTNFNVGGWTIGTGWISELAQLFGIELPTSIYVPQFTFSFTPIKFGVLEMFGVEVDLDIMAFVMAALLAVRILVRS